MRYWYDTEFLDDGERIWPISIGIVAEDDREYYAVNAAIDDDHALRLHDSIADNRWLMRNVVPHLPTESCTASAFSLDLTSTLVKPWWVVRNEIRAFLLDAPVPEGDTGVELWAWYGAYDHVMLAQTFGSMINLPKGIPMFTHDLRQKIEDVGITEERLLAAVPDAASVHNALSDAYTLRDRYWWCREQADGRW